MFRWQDIRYAFRLLAKSPLFTCLTVLVLAGGLGLSIFTFSFLYTAMVKPLPVADGARIVRVMTTVQGLTSGSVDAADLAAIRPSITTLAELGAYTDMELVASNRDGATALDVTAAEWNVFNVTRTKPMLGRAFMPGDQERGAEPVLVLGYSTWRSAFGGDSSIVGRVIQLAGAPTRVIGVMPKGYGFPVASKAWMPIRPELLEERTPDREHLLVYARLAPNRSASAANAELTTLLRRVRSARPASDSTSTTPPDGMRVESFPTAQIGDEGPLALSVLNLLATLILMLACINVTNLLLARANERTRETAVRLALGAPRARLVMQRLWEIIILCVAGGVLATVFATWLLESINVWAHNQLEGNLAFWWTWGFDRTVPLAAGMFVTLAVIVLGAVESRRALSTHINDVLKDSTTGGGAGKQGRFARLLVVVQVATVSVLLFFGSMSAVVAWRVMHVDLGYDTRNLLSTRIGTSDERQPDAAARQLFFQQLFDRLSAAAEVDGAVMRAPLADIGDDAGTFEIVGAAPAALKPRTHVQAVLGALSPLGVDLVEGRFIDSRDAANTLPVAMVSRSTAARYWPNRSPLGLQLRLTGLDKSAPSRTIVGVVDDVLLGNPLSKDRSSVAVYVPIEQSDVSTVSIEFRHKGNEMAARGAFHTALREVDPLATTSIIQSFDDVLSKMTIIARSVTQLFSGAFAFALLLALSGTYGLMAWSIARRTREIGVRRALGATDRNILQVLLGSGVRQLGIGAIAALPLTLLVGFGFSRYFIVSLVESTGIAVLVSTVVTIVVLAATWLPTRRALAVEPRDALFRD